MDSLFNAPYPNVIGQLMNIIMELLCAQILPYAVLYLNLPEYDKLVWMVSDNYVIFAFLLFLSTFLAHALFM